MRIVLQRLCAKAKGTNTHAGGGGGNRQEVIAGKLREICEIAKIAKNCGPQPPPPFALAPWRLGASESPGGVCRGGGGRTHP